MKVLHALPAFGVFRGGVRAREGEAYQESEIMVKKSLETRWYLSIFEVDLLRA